MAKRPAQPPARPAAKRKAGKPAEVPLPAEFGRRLKAAREAASVTQTELARLTGLPQSNFTDIEAGRTDVRITTARRLARALGISLHDLLPPD